MKYDSFRCNWLFIKQNQKHKHNKLAMFCQMFCLVNVLKEKVRRIESYFFLRNRNNFKKVSLYTPEWKK